ncbi:MAG: hypothetical protein EMLJLAPB_00390 [Candidatus Argoarchaeum ethanivorans]|uniref:Uncharacterized protein n=1 Tax=Candidatus Argoarchaeum ethanivorans TaxID=2608793 RepID=A0A811TEC7_9EURY|nr:MAG: hypothetical protein EMLJLAPB_00390 [Candidatus Argoarchaeum ethanivorans]
MELQGGIAVGEIEDDRYGNVNPDTLPKSFKNVKAKIRKKKTKKIVDQYRKGDQKDNDGDGKTDYPADPECTACLDPSETKPLPHVPELPTIVLFSAGLIALAGYIGLRRQKNN